MELRVRDATLYYEVRGSGPTLVFICGGPTDANVFTQIATALADRYRTVTYDPRGNSRSVFDGAPVDERGLPPRGSAAEGQRGVVEQDMDVHGDDVRALIEALGAAPAFVFGNSGGAQIGLNAVARHPAGIRALIAHEPPCMTLVADADILLAGLVHARETGRSQGVIAGFREFMALADIDMTPPPGQAPQPTDRMRANLAYFVEHGMLPIASYRPDLETLRATNKVTVGVGATSKGELAHRTALALAEKLGKSPVTFPGGHGGYNREVQAFADVVHTTLQG
jgi:pimeloyl-ACP methyl ester carboxylesterase